MNSIGINTILSNRGCAEALSECLDLNTSAKLSQTCRENREAWKAFYPGSNAEPIAQRISTTIYLQGVPDSFRANISFVKRALRGNPFGYKDAEASIKQDISVIKTALSAAVLSYPFSNEVFNDARWQCMATALSKVCDAIPGENLPLKENAEKRRFIRDDLLRQKELLDGMQGNEDDFLRVREFLHCPVFALAAVRRNPKLFKHLDEALRGDREIVLAAVQNCGWNLQFASPALQADFEIVLAAVQNDGAALEFAAPRLRRDLRIVLAAVRNAGPDAFCFADPICRTYPEVMEVFGLPAETP